MRNQALKNLRNSEGDFLSLPKIIPREDIINASQYSKLFTIDKNNLRFSSLIFHFISYFENGNLQNNKLLYYQYYIL